MTKKKNNSGPERIKMCKRCSSNKHGYFPSQDPYEVFDQGDYYTYERLPRDATCDGGIMIKFHKVSTENLLKHLNQWPRPEPGFIVKFAKEYPGRLNDIKHMLPEADLRDLLPKPRYDDSHMTDKEILEAMAKLSASAFNDDQAECNRLEFVYRERKKSRC